MRGKLRDKSSAARRDFYKRDSLERRRPAKRTTRTTWLEELIEEDENLELEEAEAEEPKAQEKK